MQPFILVGVSLVVGFVVGALVGRKHNAELEQLVQQVKALKDELNKKL